MEETTKAVDEWVAMIEPLDFPSSLTPHKRMDQIVQWLDERDRIYDASRGEISEQVVGVQSKIVREMRSLRPEELLTDELFRLHDLEERETMCVIA